MQALPWLGASLVVCNELEFYIKYNILLSGPRIIEASFLSVSYLSLNGLTESQIKNKYIL